MNYIDIISGRAGETFTGGRYYAELPILDAPSPGEPIPDISPKSFTYEYVNPDERRYTSVLANVISQDGADTTVKTRAPHEFMPNSYVTLRDGKLYQIRSVVIDTTDIPKQAARILLLPRGTAKILRLLRIDDPWGIGGKR